jgi:hypothetical protein
MKIFWFTFFGFLVGVIAVLYMINPDLLGPQALLGQFQTFYKNIYNYQPEQYVKWLKGSWIALLISVGILLFFTFWILLSWKRNRTLEEHIFELRSQIAELLKNRDR